MVPRLRAETRHFGVQARLAETRHFGVQARLAETRHFGVQARLCRNAALRRAGTPVPKRGTSACRHARAETRHFGVQTRLSSREAPLFL
jgi:hypothetical protein